MNVCEKKNYSHFLSKKHLLFLYQTHVSGFNELHKPERPFKLVGSIPRGNSQGGIVSSNVLAIDSGLTNTSRPLDWFHPRSKPTFSGRYLNTLQMHPSFVAFFFLSHFVAWACQGRNCHETYVPEDFTYT